VALAGEGNSGCSRRRRPGSDAGLRHYELLDPAAVRTVNPALRGEFAGGLLCRADAAVEPCQVPLALRTHLLDGTSDQPRTSGCQAGRPSSARVTNEETLPAACRPRRG
jgi:hypothetical protein